MKFGDYLTDDWRDAWRWWSVQLMAIGAFLGPVWNLIPDEWTALLPDWLGSVLSSLIFLLAMLARIHRQGDEKEAADGEAS